MTVINNSSQSPLFHINTPEDAIQDKAMQETQSQAEITDALASLTNENSVTVIV